MDFHVSIFFSQVDLHDFPFTLALRRWSRHRSCLYGVVQS
jgi:hypothetical protein